MRNFSIYIFDGECVYGYVASALTEQEAKEKIISYHKAFHPNCTICSVNVYTLYN